MNKYIIFLLLITSCLSAWEDHPDRDEDRRNDVKDSQCFVGGGYDWGSRDTDSRDRDDRNSDSEGRGTTGGPHDSKD